MKLFEYEAKEILSKYEVPVPRGALANSPSQSREVASQLNPPYVAKAQVLVAGRGKAGGIQFAETEEELEQGAARILNMKLKGLRVSSVWVEEKIQTKKELYFGVTTDRSRRCYVAIGSTSGGVDIEEVASKTPKAIIRVFINPVLGFRGYHARYIAGKMGYSGRQMITLATIFERFYQAAMEQDAELAEMNPLVETAHGTFVAADARFIVDDNALYRHPRFKDRLLSEDKTELTPDEVEARKAGLAYLKLDGDISIMGNGAGLVMATLDAVQLYGGKPANFLDVGGGASEEQILSALRILLADKQSSGLFINILGGITRCDNVARGILKARKSVAFTKPMVIRLVGTKQEEGRRILTEAGIHVLDSMEEAAEKAVEMSGR